MIQIILHTILGLVAIIIKQAGLNMVARFKALSIRAVPETLIDSHKNMHAEGFG